MKVKTQSERATKGRALVFRSVVADQPQPSRPMTTSRNSGTGSAPWASPPRAAFPAMMRARTRSQPFRHRRQSRCLHPVRPVRARLPRGAIERSDRHGLSRHGAKVIFDFDEGMGDSPACLRRMRAGVSHRRTHGIEAARRQQCPASNIHPQRRYRLPLLRRCCQTTAHIKDDKFCNVDGRDGPANNNRLCVKGRFGFD